jgi:primase-like protein
MPEWALKKLGEKDKQNRIGKPRSPEFYNKLIERAPEGMRNERVAALFGHLFGSAFPDRVVLCDLVLCWNLARCSPPLSDDEVISIAKSIARCEAKKREAAQ